MTKNCYACYYVMTELKMQCFYAPRNTSHPPPKKQLTSEEKQEAITILNIHGSKKLLQKRIFNDTWKMLIFKDLHYLQGRAKPSNNASTLIEEMKKLSGKYSYLFCPLRIVAVIHRSH